jgi:hypothetical protein
MATEIDINKGTKILHLDARSSLPFIGIGIAIESISLRENCINVVFLFWTFSVTWFNK